MNKVKQTGGAAPIVFLAWLVYTTSYLGKVNYSANITQIIDFYGITRAEAGAVPTFLFFSYGIGQVVNGLFCSRYNIKRTVFLSLFLTGCINFTVAVSTEFALVKWLWLVNGFLLSMLWPTLIRLLSETLPQKEIGGATVIMGTPVALGTFLIYALSSVYAAFDNFKLAFFTAAIAALAVSFLWLFFYDRVVFSLRACSEGGLGRASGTVPAPKRGKMAKDMLGTVSVLCFCAVGVNLIKDGLTTWVPAILKEEGSLSDSLSILLTLCLPLVAIAANAFALYTHKKIPNYVTHMMTVFAVVMGLILAVIGALSEKQLLLMFLGMVTVNFLVSGLNSLVTSIFPMYMRGQVSSGRWAGILNGFCYMGSTLSSYGLGAVADRFGWRVVLWCLFLTCGLIVFVCAADRILRKTKKAR